MKKFNFVRLAALRKKLGLSGEKLGTLVGLTQGFISALERGEKSPSIDTALSLAGALGTSLAYLTGETNDPRVMREEDCIPFSFNEATQIDAKTSIDKKESPVNARPVSMEDFARTREASRNADSLDDRDLNAAEEMLLASLEAIQKEKGLRTAKYDGAVKSA